MCCWPRGCCGNGRNPLAHERKPIFCYVTDRRGLQADAVSSGSPAIAPASDSAKFLHDSIRRALRSGVSWIQIREKDLSAREQFELVRAILKLPNPRGVKILVNTRVDIALAARADGVHLPSNSPAPHVWRELVPPRFLIGVSCHSLAEIQAAEREGADYALFGPVFDPISKPANSPAVGLTGLSRAAAAVKIPVLALGGITRTNAESCVAAGAAGIAGISVFQNISQYE